MISIQNHPLEFDTNYPFTFRMGRLFLNNHTFYRGPLNIDFERLKKYLLESTISPDLSIVLPTDREIWLDFEYVGNAPETCTWEKDGSLNQPLLDYKIKVLEFARSVRPDYKIGYYNTPGYRWDFDVTEPDKAKMQDSYHAAYSTLSQLADYVMPPLYFDKPEYTAEQMAVHANTKLSRIKRFNPNTEIIPLLCPFPYYNIPVSERKPISGEKVLPLLNVLANHGVKRLGIWNEGPQERDFRKDSWWREVIRWEAATVSREIDKEINATASRKKRAKETIGLLMNS